MKIGELARISGVAASRIRFYEASGLLEPPQRQSNGYREYPPDALTRLGIIMSAQGSGFSLEEIRAILPPDLAKWPHDQLLEALRRKVEEIALLEQRLAQNKQRLQQLIDEIDGDNAGENCEDRARRMLGQLDVKPARRTPAKPPSRGKRAVA